MTLTSLLDVLHTQGVSLAVHGDTLMVDAPKGVLTDALRQAIRQHKQELLALLELFEEHAALVEYDGRLPHTEAERLAWRCVLG